MKRIHIFLQLHIPTTVDIHLKWNESTLKYFFSSETHAWRAWSSSHFIGQIGMQRAFPHLKRVEEKRTFLFVYHMLMSIKHLTQVWCVKSVSKYKEVIMNQGLDLATIL